MRIGQRRAWRVSIGLSVMLAAGCGSCDSGDQKAQQEQAASSGKDETTGSDGRLVILGFDGVDPDWVEKWVGQGKLPNLKKLIEAHDGAGFQRLRSTNPPQSPVAWTSFATGTRPGDHGIFDFIRRKLIDRPQGPPVMPAVGTTNFQVHKVGPPTAENLRNGVPFWKTLSDRGVPVHAIHIPYSFPPDPLKHGRMLSGLGVPDLRGTNSTFTYVGTDVTQDDVDNPPGGGVMVPLDMKDGQGTFQLKGPRIAAQPGERMAVSVKVTTGKPKKGMTVVVQDQKIALKPRKFSEWVELTFEHKGKKIRGIAKFLALEAGDETRLLVTPMSFDPRKPWSPISSPDDFAKKLTDVTGLYKTVGWDHDTSALNAEALSEKKFLERMDTLETKWRKMLLHGLDRDDWRTLIWVSTAPDRVSHMFYRLIDPKHPMYDEELAKKYGNAILHEYQRMDETVGKVLKRLREDDTLLIISDHGFHNFRRGLHVNQWLRQNGYLTLKDGKKVADREFLLDVNWSKTQAYALGTGQIYLNIKGREREGIVPPKKAPKLAKEIRKGLLKIRDEAKDDAKVLREVYLGREVFKGEESRTAPELQLAFYDGYRTSWKTVLGGVPEGLFADNKRKWSGDHAASDVKNTSGILISNEPVRKEVGIVDLAPTALRYFGKKPPARYDGQPVLRSGAL